MTLQLPLRCCPNPTCKPIPCIRDCPKERAKASRLFRMQIRRHRAVGPMPFWLGRWMHLQEGWDPWSMMERKSASPP